MCLDEPLETPARADLLVRDGHEHELARGREALTFEGSERDRRGRHLSLHVERAATPDLAVDEFSGPRVALPLRRVGKNGVRVREEGERRAVAASQTRHDVGTVGLARVQLHLDVVRREVVAEHLRGAHLVARRIDGLRADQRLQERGRLLAEAHYVEAFESAVSSLRTSHSSGYEVFVTSRPSSSTGVPWVPTTLSPITRATTW